jgi:release factor glutamine methyltransferase
MTDRTIASALAMAMPRLAAADIPKPRREARLILSLAMGVDHSTVLGYPERVVPDAAYDRFAELVARREKHEPFSRLLGKREFWSLDFALSPDTLDPRPDSETLIEAVLAEFPDRSAPLRIVDYGTGSGCLLLTLLSELPQATGTGIDLSPGAIDTARRNTESLGLSGRAVFRRGDWDHEIAGPADVIVSNPPYIPSDEIDHLAPEVADFDPRLALDGGEDGLEAYRSLIPVIKQRLAPGGVVFFEIGAGQAEDVAGLLAKTGLQLKTVRRDLAGQERCLVATFGKSPQKSHKN